VGDPARDADGRPHAHGPEVTTIRTAAGLLLPAALLGLPLTTGAAQTWRTVTSARQVHGERELNLELEYGAGRLRVSPGATGELYRLEMRYDEDRFSPIRTWDPATGSLRLGIRGREGIRVSRESRRSEEPPFLNLALSPDIPLALAMEAGAAEVDIELGGLALRRLRYETGASATRLRFSRPNPVSCELLEMRAGAAEFDVRQIANANCARVRFEGGVGRVVLDFTGTWRGSMEADLDVGFGSLDLRLPRDVGVAVHLSRFLASFDAAGFEKRGDVYYSANWATARQKLTMRVNASIGGVQVAWAGPQ
jgi:hypothetical protein